MPSSSKKRSHSPTPASTIAADSSPSSSRQNAKKLKLHASYTVAGGPFPDFEHPTPEEAQKVYDLLLKEHPINRAVRKVRSTPVKQAEQEQEDKEGVLNPASNSAGTCGNVPNVIDALIGTVLSQNTSSKNSSGAKRTLDATFGRGNFEAIALAPRAEVVEALRHGGLANKKAETIQRLLREIKERYGVYSLQHLADASDSDSDSKKHTDSQIMQELLSYPGVGPKTASCVLLFCLGRDSFAVDTHVFRLSRLLGWFPVDKVGKDRVLAQAHLDERVPGELKHGLHVLMIQHGRVCRGCKTASGGGGAKEGGCVLRRYVREQSGHAVRGNE